MLRQPGNTTVTRVRVGGNKTTGFGFEQTWVQISAAILYNWVTLAVILACLSSHL